MSHVDGFVTPIPSARRAAYRRHAETTAAPFCSRRPNPRPFTRPASFLFPE